MRKRLFFVKSMAKETIMRLVYRIAPVVVALALALDLIAVPVIEHAIGGAESVAAQ